jgi:hypothetical protein
MKAGDVLQEHQWDLALAAQLDEVGRLSEDSLYKMPLLAMMPTGMPSSAQPQIAWFRSAPELVKSSSTMRAMISRHRTVCVSVGMTPYNSARVFRRHAIGVGRPVC